MTDKADKLDAFTQAYIECALWSSTDDEGENLDNYSIHDLTPEALAEMVNACQDFQTTHDNAELLESWYAGGETPERAGHDFWLTRNRHGAGFWDRYYSGSPMGKLGNKLSDLARTYGDCDLYVTDDGKVGIQ